MVFTVNPEVVISVRMKSFLPVCHVKDNNEQPQLVQTGICSWKTLLWDLQVNKASLPPVATLWYLIPSAFWLLQLVGKRGLVTHILEDDFGTSEYNRDWSGEGIGTEMSRHNLMGNMIRAIEQFRAALCNLTLITQTLKWQCQWAW